MTEPDVDSMFGGTESTGATEPFATPGLDPDSMFGTAETATPSKGSGHAPKSHTPSGGPTMFQQSTAPAPADHPEMTWGETLGKAATNFIPSVGGTVAAAGHAITHPGETVEALGQVGKGAISQAAGAMGVKQDPKEKAANEAVLNALEEHYKTGYGSKKGFKQMLATDPASVLMDLSTVATPAIGIAGKAGDAASLLTKATDPVQAALNVAKRAGTGTMSAVRGAQSVTTGVPTRSLRAVSDAVDAGAPAGAAETYSHFASGAGTPQEAQIKLINARDAVAKDVSANYRESMGNMVGSIDTSELEKQSAALRAEINQGSTALDANGRPLGNPQAKSALDAIDNYIAEMKTNPAKREITEADAFKKQIWDLKSTYTGDKSDQIINGMYHTMRNSISAVDPNYAKLMEQYTFDTANLNDITKTLGARKTVPATQAAIKAMRATKNNTIAGAGRPLIDQLAAKDPTIPYMLAGIATKDWMPNGLRHVAEGAGPIGMLLHPASALPIAGAMASTSPKLAAIVNGLTGRMSKVSKTLAKPVITKPAYYSGRADQQNQPQADPVFQHMLDIESGNLQTDSAGKPIVSPAGAVGAAQIMPKTGPEAAAAAGETFDPQRLATDYDYNVKLGHAYYSKMRDRFGDPLLAAAAYNAGPDAVDAALRHGSNYFDHLPAETQGYVRQIQQRMSGAATGGRITRAAGGRVDIDSLVNKLISRWRGAKKVTDEMTKPLLRVPDAAIIKALDISQEHI
jgi:hypothetical protein